MAERINTAAAEWKAPTSEAMHPYLRPDAPKLNLNVLQVELYTGDRSMLNTLTAGEATLLVRYKSREGYVTSVEEKEDDLMIVQLQGSKQEGYRVVQGLKIEDFLADQTYALATNPPGVFRRITIPDPQVLTDNMSSIASHNAVLRIPEVIERYTRMIGRLRMNYSREENMFIVDIPFRTTIYPSHAAVV